VAANPASANVAGSKTRRVVEIMPQSSPAISYA
jgi:hypothetical protein